MTTTGFIYDTEDGACLAVIRDGKDVFDATGDAQRIGTIDDNGNVYSLHGELIGHLRAVGDSGDGSTPAALKTLLRKRNTE